MIKDPVNPALWSCDYNLPQGFDEATYYFQVNYMKKLNSGALKPGEIKSDLQVFRLENRYVGNLASYRGLGGLRLLYRVVGSPNMTQSPLAGRKLKPLPLRK